MSAAVRVGMPCSVGAAQPLRIEAHPDGPVWLDSGQIALDALLAYAVAVVEGLPPLDVQPDRRPADIEIPVLREPGGRFHLASFGVYEAERHELQHTHRRFPVAEAAMLGVERLRRIQLNAGPSKSYRLPRPVMWLRGDLVQWWCLGDPARIRPLLELITYLGRKRSAGLGRIASWSVEPCSPWEHGFPVVLEGQPLRFLPADWHGLAGARVEHRRLTYPYHSAHVPMEPCAVPEWL